MSSSDDDFTKVQNLVRDRKRSRTISNISVATAAAEDENPKKQLCHLCQKESIPDMDQSHQQLLEYDSLRAHYFCLLFSSGLGQSGTESEGKSCYIIYFKNPTAPQFYLWVERNFLTGM